MLENLSTFRGEPGHEVVHVFAVPGEPLAALPDEDVPPVLDTGEPVRWVALEEFDDEAFPLFPSGALALLRADARRDVPAGCGCAREQHLLG
ncbi:NUDIX hydrolase [Kineococcus auxinigenes]|uniref:hypothetical protein n=1 Tax=unclassified Kineococcus TaxID=2621656 RepID=UPI003D7CD7AD